MSGTQSGSILDGLGLDAGGSDMGLLGLLQGLGQASAASRLPVSNGSALGLAAAGLMGGQQKAQEYALRQQQLQAAQMQNQFNAQLLPAKAQAASALFGGGGTPMGAPLMPGAGGSGAPASSGAASSGLVQVSGPNDPAAASVRDLIARRNYAQVTGDGAGLRAMQTALDQIAGPGGVAAPDGSVYAVPGAAQSRFTTSQAEAAGKVGPETTLAANKAAIETGQTGARAAAAAQAQAPYQPPITVNVPGLDGQLREMQIPRPAWAAQNGAGGAPGGATAPAGAMLPAALGSIADPQARSMAVNAALAAGLPPQAWPAWISAVHNESGWNLQQPNGSAGEIGPGQVKPGTGQMVGFTPQQLTVPQTNLTASAKYFGQKWQQANGDPAGALAGYNTGTVTGNAPRYVNTAMGRLQQWSGGAAQQPGMPAGAIPGKPILTPEQDAESKAYGEQSAGIIAADAKAPSSLQRLDVIANAAQGFRPGVTGTLRLDAAKAMTDALQSIGVTPPAWVQNGAAAGETIGKEGGYLASEMTRQLGSREAASVFNQVRNIQPNIDMSTGGFQAITNSIRQGVQRDQDLARFREQWLANPQNGGSIKGMLPAFEQKYPVQSYASRVVPYPMPKSQDQAMPNVIYNTARGPALWTGSAFQALQ